MTEEQRREEIARLFDVPVELIQPGFLDSVLRDTDRIASEMLAQYIAPAIRNAPALGIITAQPIPTEPAPALTIEDIYRTMRQIEAAGYPRHMEFRHGGDVPGRLAEGLDLRPDPNTTTNAVFGVPMVVDETLAPDEWRLVDEHGRVLHRSVGVGDDDILSRIDSAVEAWERGPDAYRHIPDRREESA